MPELQAMLSPACSRSSSTSAQRRPQGWRIATTPTPPKRLTGADRPSPVAGRRSSAPFATSTPRPGGRPKPGWAPGPGRAHLANGDHRRPGHAAGRGNLVSGHQPAPLRITARRRQPTPDCRPDQTRPHLRHPQLDRTRLQTDQKQTGLADFQVRSALAIRRYQIVVYCSFSFCWATWLANSPPPGTSPAASREREHDHPVPVAANRSAVSPAPSGATRSERSADGWLRPLRSHAGGVPGPKRPCPLTCKH